MTLSLRKGSGEVLPALIANYNLLRKEVATARSQFHRGTTCGPTTGEFTDLSSTAVSVTAADSDTDPKTVTLANNIKAVLNAHLADATSHLKADSDNGPITTANATNLSTAEALLNACQTAFDTHLAQSGVHVTNDSTNSQSAVPVASSSGTAITLANALKAAINAHLLSAPAGKYLNLVSA